MRRANAQLQSDRRAEIMAAAERCFVRAGFHQTSMQEICAEAGMSPGNLYRYFVSKEAIIAGICERDRADATRDFTAVGQSPDFFQALAALAQHHMVEKPAHEVALFAELMAESRRNPDIARLWRDCDADVSARMVEMLRAAAAKGEIAADLDFERVTAILTMVYDGLCWRRAIEPDFDAAAVTPIILEMVRRLLMRPMDTADAPQAGVGLTRGELQ
jgi:TetR/AcrR family transcriptional repressor of uid operon